MLKTAGGIFHKLAALMHFETRSTQRAQTSAECQHNRIAEWFLQGIRFVRWERGSSSQIQIMIRNGLPDPDGDADHCQNVISWSLGHTPAIHKISSKSIGNFFDNPVNADFGLLDPEGDPDRHQKWTHWSLGRALPLQRNFIKIRSQLFQLSNRQTNRPKWR